MVRPLNDFLSSVVNPDRRTRRLWVCDGRAHIEVRGLDRAESGSLRAAIKSGLEQLEGVDWADVNAVTGRVAVVFDGDALGTEDLLDVIDGVEEAHDVSDETFPGDRPEHPGDGQALQRNITAVAADVIGLAFSVFGQVLQATPIPAELASVVTLIDSTPRIRRVLETNFGHPATDLGLAVANAAAQALAQGPTGLLVDIGYRLSLMTEVRARQEAWARREPELSSPDHGLIPPLDAMPRPVPLPSGPIERYTDRASVASLGAFGIAWGVTGSPRVAASALLSGLPKAARMGREAFAAQASRALADRGVVLLDPGVMRRLDRVDTVVVDAGLLTTGNWELADAAVLNEALETSEALRRAQALFEPRRVNTIQRRESWVLGPLAALDVVLPPGTGARARALRAGGARVLGLVHRGDLVALVKAVAELDPLAQALGRAVRDDGHLFVVAGTQEGVTLTVGADRRVGGGRRLAASVRDLQVEGRVVALIGRDPAALQASDCGIGLLATRRVPPWGAHMLCGPGLAGALLVCEALAVARRTSETSARLALAGSAVGAIGALVSPPGQAARRTLLAVNGAAMVALGVGTWAGVSLGRRPVPHVEGSVAWHEMDGDAVVSTLGSSLTGLGHSDVAARLREASHLVVDEPLTLGRAIFEELATPLTPVLGVGAALSAAVGSITDASLVGGVVGANALISALQRLRTDRSLRNLMATSAVNVRVRRGGVATEIAPENLVMGDIVIFGPGDLVPADCRVLDANSIEVDESALTGESFPVLKTSAPCPEAAVAERACMLYQGTTVVAGTTTAVVVAVGESTEAARAIAAGGQPPRTGVEGRLRHLTDMTVPVSVLSGVGVTALSVLRGQPLPAAISSGVGLMVASVPEGLPLLAGVAQLAAARRLAERHVLVRNPASIEALGRVNTLCFDKTGTLTEGRIALQRVCDGRRDEALPKLSVAGRAILRVALRATPVGADDAPVAHATDQAVLDGAAAAAVERGDQDSIWDPRVDLPFEATRGFHAVMGAAGDRHVLAVKGAPEVVLPRCERWPARGPGPLEGTHRRQLDEQVERLARSGLRVLAVADRTIVEGETLSDDSVDDLEFVGFLALADAVRPTAAAAVEGLRRAGVEVAMITGDHPSTAEAIAAELGILDGRRVLTGGELDDLDDTSLAAVLPTVSVFARVTPAHKVRIVAGLQRAGRIVAMTGDGANDAAAIRLAHAGIALGQRGAAPARAAADLVVTDDHIETLVEAIVEGRAMWASVRDALAILVGGNLGEVAFTLVTTAVTGTSPLNARQLLIVNLLTDLFPAMAIAVRPPRGMSPEELLHEGPESSLGEALVRDIVWRGATTAAGAGAAWALARATGPSKRASTVGLVALVGTQLGQTIISGRASPLVVVSSLAAGGALAVIVQTPGLSQFFGCTPLDPLAWVIGIGSATVATGASVLVPTVLHLGREVSSGAPAA